MKRILMVCMVAVITCFGASAQTTYSWLGTGSYTSTGTTFPLLSTAVHTVVATAVDTLTHPMHSGYVTSGVTNNLNSITYTIDVYKIAGTPTVNVALYGSANYGTTYATTPVATYTVYPTSTTVPVTINYTVTGNPLSDYLWSATGSASSTVKWQSSALIR